MPLAERERKALWLAQLHDGLLTRDNNRVLTPSSGSALLLTPVLVNTALTLTLSLTPSQAMTRV